MGLNLDEKKAVVAEVSAEVAKAQGIVVAEYRGLEVGSMTELRAKARKSGLYLRVLKNTLARRAVKGTPFEKLSEQMVGPLMYSISQDPVAGAKVLSAFAKDNEKLVIRGGAMPNVLMSVKDVKALAALPSREELLAVNLDQGHPGYPAHRLEGWLKEQGGNKLMIYAHGGLNSEGESITRIRTLAPYALLASPVFSLTAALLL